MINGTWITGLDFVCASLTLAYIARLLLHAATMHDSIGVMCGVAKVSLRGQQVAHRLR